MTKKLLLLALGFSLTTQLITAQVPSYVPTDGLSGWWSFNGNANDASTNGNNGTVNGATLTADRFGNPNSAYSFDGLTNYINIPSQSSISDFPNGQTISFWMKISAYPNDGKEHYMICKNDNSGLPTAKFYQTFISDFSNVDNIVYRYAESASSSSQGTAIPFANVPLNQWLHICFTTDLTTTKTYVNGILFQTYTQFSTIGITTNPLLFGKNSGVTTTSSPFNGNLDDIGIWNRPLTQDEITNLYNANICYQNITVTDTLVINTGILSYNPVTYNNTVTIYPNPANDHITIDCGNLANVMGYQIKIFNELGQTVFTGAMNQQQYTVPLNTWGGNGVYLVKIYDASSNVLSTKKIILQ
jgi:hypothetical protein